jgi:hypothetical protein
MRVIAFLAPGSAVPRLRSALPVGATLELFEAVGPLIHALVHGWSDLAVIDPLAMRDDSFTEVVEAMHASRSAIVLLTLLGSVSAARCIQASQRAAIDLVFLNFDNDSRLLKAVLRAQGGTETTGLLFHELAPQFAVLDRRIRNAVAGLFGRADMVFDVRTFAEPTELHRTTVEGQIKAAGFASVHDLIRSVPVTRTFERLKRGSQTADIAADAAGYPTRTMMARDYKTLVGLSPVRAGKVLERPALVQRVAERLRTRGP